MPPHISQKKHIQKFIPFKHLIAHHLQPSQFMFAKRKNTHITRRETLELGADLQEIITYSVLRVLKAQTAHAALLLCSKRPARASVVGFTRGGVCVGQVSEWVGSVYHIQREERREGEKYQPVEIYLRSPNPYGASREEGIRKGNAGCTYYSSTRSFSSRRQCALVSRISRINVSINPRNPREQEEIPVSRTIYC